MRKAMFALTLVFAAFAGGAAVNGPGLGLVKAAILARIGPGRSIIPAQPPNPPAPIEPKAVPSAPPPPLVEAPARDAKPPRPEPAFTAIPPEPAPADPEVAPAARTVGAPRDWSGLRGRMRELGVSRYEIEGDPGGRCRFRCLIPLAGRRAVGQQFEGEGDDDFSAAEAALRRVALWRASELAPP